METIATDIGSWQLIIVGAAMKLGSVAAGPVRECVLAVQSAVIARPHNFTVGGRPWHAA